eukprot:CAMPEP_0184055452 /NCGR_PEP_ID=MMETSP0956-20121227/7180_1 /TAXON_ID=627963 /ORGANISM="Aplanochytrium sp, Strain PBS07" /LENGTH=233 /DNA_ID=CAMNT_0026349269 /DNA_START=41 /DNA_END=739 /DNA_ORIENTATION=+
MSIRIIPAACKPADVKNTLAYLKKLDGRDKSLKLLQYVSRYFSYQLLLSDPKSDLGERLKLLYKGVSLNRKAFRLGMFVDEYKKFEKTLNEAKDDMKKRLTLLKSFAQGLYYFFDNMSWLLSLKVITGDKDSVKVRAARFRLTAAIASILMCIMDISSTQEKILGSKPESKERVKAEEKQGKNTVTLVKSVCDILVYGNNAKFVEMIKGKKYDDGTIGLLGSISALAGIYSIW